MKTLFLTFFLIALSPAVAFAVSLSVTPENPVQGEPVRVTLEEADIPSVKALTFAGKKIGLFLYQGKPTALIPIDLAGRVGAYPLGVELYSGEKRTKMVTVRVREKIFAPLGIPEKLGGNTPASASNLVTNLSKENATLSKLPVTLPPWWGEPFIFPLESPEVIDAYGYSRNTGSYSIAHKGTDFRAPSGTPVRAINSGIVRLARTFIIYGKLVAIDHGGGVGSLSLHLSRVQVKEGQKVRRGEVIGFSGESGYATGPHLHLSVRINGISIDPMKFFALFGAGA